MNGIFITNKEYNDVTFTNPKDLFNGRDITFIGACVEKNLVFMGLKDARHLPVNDNIPRNLLSMSVFDEPPRGPVLIVETNQDGMPI